MRGENISDIIFKVEEKWLEKLSAFIEEHFKQIFLPSHDQQHHLRTWNIAKNILINISEVNSSIDESFVEAVLLSTILHDTGMVETRNPVHGAYGKIVYLKFIEQADSLPKYHKEIARAIDLHDRKAEDFYEFFTLDKPSDLLTLTSIADDLDALGIIGIYRYIEIYLHRGVPLKTLGMKVLENITLRYNHICKATVLYPSICKSSLEAYKEIVLFFDNYNQQLLIEDDPNNSYSGHIGIVNYIKQFSVHGTYTPTKFLGALEGFNAGKFVVDFFTKLEHECSNFY